MKFTNGQWLIKDGYKIIHPHSVRNYVISDNMVTIYAPVIPVEGRKDTIDTSLITIQFFSPQPEIIGVRIFHFKGSSKKYPEFSLYKAEKNPIKINQQPDKLILTSGHLSVHIHKEKYALDFFNDNQNLTRSNFKNTGYLIHDQESFIREQLELKVGETVYGLGEHFTPFVKNGQFIDIWNEDGGTNSEQSYKNIPFYQTNKGYGVFVNHPEHVSFEVGSESVSRIQFSVTGEYLEYYVINGPSPKKILENYTLLTGRPAMPPAWSFGLWLSTSFTTRYDEKTVTSFIDGMKERNIPLSVFHFDCFWMKEYQLVNLEWNAEDFPDPAGMLMRLKKKGVKICVWINPYIAQQSPLFDEAMKNGYFLKRVNGDVWQWDRWQAGMGIIDFTNPNACKWYTGYLEKLIDMGVDCFKTDFGERIPLDVVYDDRSDPYKMHNYYSLIYNKLVFELLERKLGKGNAIVFARSATAGGQKYPVHWGGDCWARYESMAESLRGGLSLCLSGFTFWSHDIGGFENTAPHHVYKRWIAFGLFSSHSRLHGNNSYRVPWNYDEESVDVLRFFTRLKCRLMPYIFAKAVEAVQTGIPIMRAMILEFPEDPACDYLDRQYMFGDNLLVAPVFEEAGNVSYYLPDGQWTNFLTGEDVQGGRWIHEQHGFLSLPLFVRDNSILALGQTDHQPDYDYADHVVLHVFNLGDQQPVSTKVYNEQTVAELEVSVVKNEKTITIEIINSRKPWSMVLNGIKECQVARNCTVKSEKEGLRLIPDNKSSRIFIELK